MAGRGAARCGTARQEWLGKARPDLAWRGVAWQVRLGVARPVKARSGLAWRGVARQVRHGLARPGEGWQRGVRHGSEERRETPSRP